MVRLTPEEARERRRLRWQRHREQEQAKAKSVEVKQASPLPTSIKPSHRTIPKARILGGKGPVRKMTVMSEWETLNYLLKGGSISRYGDGELKHMNGKRNVSQVFHGDLQQALVDTFNSRTPGHLVAIPNVFGGRIFTEVLDDYIVQMKRKFGKWGNPKYRYGSSYISRGDLCGYLSWPLFWSQWFKLWQDRDVVLVRGNPKRAGEQMFYKAASLIHVETPSLGAWKDYDKILRDCLTQPKDALYLLCVGPTATVLAWDLAKRGRQGVDLGHLGLFYNRSWGIEHDDNRQVWHHRPTDPGYKPGNEY